MALKGLNLTETRKVASKYDTEEDQNERTLFEIGTLDSRIAAMLRDKGTTVTVNPAAMSDEVDSQINMNIVNFEACVYGLKGWERFRDENGDDIEFRTVKRNHGGVSYKVADPACVKLIPGAVIQELGQEIMKDNDLTEIEAKN